MYKRYNKLLSTLISLGIIGSHNYYCISYYKTIRLNFEQNVTM